jgi:nucleotide-binding universal stress UspA family protein
MKLVFLFVIDTSNLHEADEKLRPAVRDELAWIGTALLRIAQQRATAADIDSEIVLREGPVRDEICEFLKERSAHLLLVGAPRGTSAAVFGDDKVEQFASEIERETAVQVEIVRPQLVENW